MHKPALTGSARILRASLTQESIFIAVHLLNKARPQDAGAPSEGALDSRAGFCN